MTVSEAKRKEITVWATQKAMDDAKSLNKDVLGAAFSDWLKEKIWHYEKMAYLKIDRRESGRNK
jgi:hypothetical protein